MTEKLRLQLKFLAEADKLKNILRQTYIIDGSRQENSAEHSWHFALTAMTLFEYCGIEGVDIDRVLKMALVHDLVEVYAGDTPAYDKKGNLDKGEREKEAADRLFPLLPDEQAAEYRSLWEEFERIQTPDALFGSAVDRLQSFHNIHLSGAGPWKKYAVTSDEVLERMAPVKTALPRLWEYVESVIDENIKRGNIKPNDGQ
ncbi:MAG: HD domain-containing protein [Oscillospiraceae bacterium]|nr:HD domain-containing protein [Oscillospiraceae bacterium]